MQDLITWKLQGALAFSEDFSSLTNESCPLSTKTYSILKATILRTGLRFHPFLAPLIGVLNPQKVFQEALDLFQKNKAKVHRRLEKPTARTDIMTHVLDSAKMSIPEIESTFNILTLAGSDTVASLLTSMTSQLLRSPSKLHRLVTEIRAAFTIESAIAMNTVNQLPYLNAAISESLRLDPPSPGQNPRVVPDPGDTICGHYIQGGVSRPPFQLKYSQNTHLTPTNRPSSLYRNSASTAPPRISRTQKCFSQNAGSRPPHHSSPQAPRPTRFSRL